MSHVQENRRLLDFIGESIVDSHPFRRRKRKGWGTEHFWKVLNRSHFPESPHYVMSSVS